MSALDIQVGGGHYKDKAIQPVEYIHANKLDFFQGNVVKYVTRWRDKGGMADLEKARHYLDMYMELEKKAQKKAEGAGADNLFVRPPVSPAPNLLTPGSFKYVGPNEAAHPHFDKALLGGKVVPNDEQG